VQRPARPSHGFGTSTPGFHVGANEPENDMRPGERVSGSASGGSNIRDELRGTRPNHGFSPINSTASTTNQSVLPSPSTNPPYSTVFNQPDGTPNQAVENVDSPKRWKRRRTGLVDQSPRSLTPTEFSVNTIPERDIIQYIDM
jgi:hypothetical protein